MNQLRVDDRFSAALRAELVARARQTAPIGHSRLWIGAGVLAGAGLLGGVAASAAGIFTVPGSEEATPLASDITRTYAGTATVELGAAPQGATSIEMELTCLTAGHFEWPDGASLECSAADAVHRTTAGYTLQLSPGQRAVTIKTDAGNRWQLTVRYVKQQRTDWGINAKGQTYGVEIPGKGSPDLIAVQATNGKNGYVYGKDLQGPQPTSPDDAAKNFTSRPPRDIPVYLSDGETQIGVFTIGGSSGLRPSAPTR